MASLRDDVAERRRRLRRLDVALANEVDDAGAMTLAELGAEVNEPLRLLLGTTASKLTLAEWWTYAQRRGVLVVANEGETSPTGCPSTAASS